jgi:hypothetical protein
MPRRRRNSSNRKIDRIEFAIKGGLGVLMLLALASGGIVGFGERLIALILVTFLLAICAAAIAGIIFVIRRTNWTASQTHTTTSTNYQRTYQSSNSSPSYNTSKAGGQKGP